MVERLAVDFEITLQDVLDQVAPGATLGRPHIADALVARGIVPEHGAAFEELLHPRNKYYVHNPSLAPVDAVRMVRAAGGLSGQAHPGASVRGRTVGPEVIEARSEERRGGKGGRRREGAAGAAAERVSGG